MREKRIYKMVLLILIASAVYIVDCSAQSNSSLSRPELRETVWLSSDRHLFVPGEKVSFTANLLETDTYIPSSLSTILRVELLDSTGRSISRQKYQIVDGTVSQSLSLPSSLESGWYFLKAYTSWMRNFPESNNCFLPIKVINPGSLQSIVNPIYSSEVVISLIPEQGSFRAGNSNNIVIRATGRQGGGRSIKGTISKEGSGQEIPFETGPTGWTMIDSDLANLNNVSVSVEGFDQRSIILNIKDYNSETPFVVLEEIPTGLRLSVQNLTPGASSSYKLMVHSTGTIYYYNVSQDGSDPRFTVPKVSIPNGIFQLTVLDLENRIVARKLWISRNTFASSPDIILDYDTLLTRDSGIFSLRMTPTEGKLPEHLMMQVKKKEPHDPLKEYLPGLPGWPASWEIPAREEDRAAWVTAMHYPDTVVYSFFRESLNDPVIHNYNSKSLIDDIEREVRFMPETRGISLNGSVTSGSSGPGIQNVYISTTILNDNSFYADRTFSSGRFHISYPFVNESLDMIVGFIEEPEADYILTIEPDYDNPVQQIRVPEFDISEDEIIYIRDLNINQQINSIYQQTSAPTKLNNPSKERKGAFFGNPDDRVIVDDFIRLPNMREVIFEVVPTVHVRKTNNEYKLSISGDQLTPGMYRPVFLLDGIPIYKFNDFLDLPPERIKQIDVKNQLFIHGNAVFGGAVSFTSMNGDLAGLDLPQKSQLISLGMPLASSPFQTEDVKSISENIPMLSNTLLWKINFNSRENNINFTTNDNPGDYTIAIYGFNNLGQWLQVEKEFRVGR